MTRQEFVLRLSVIAVLLPAAAGIAVASWDPYFSNPAVIADFGAASRPFGIAAGDFDEDGRVDLVVGRVTGNLSFLKGNGDGTFAAPVTFAWKQAYFNAWSLTAADLNGDNNLDLVWEPAPKARREPRS